MYEHRINKIDRSKKHLTNGKPHATCRYMWEAKINGECTQYLESEIHCKRQAQFQEWNKTPEILRTYTKLVDSSGMITIYWICFLVYSIQIECTWKECMNVTFLDTHKMCFFRNHPLLIICIVNSLHCNGHRDMSHLCKRALGFNMLCNWLQS